MIPNGRAAKILLIDSNVYFAKKLGDALKREGFEVISSTQAAFALTTQSTTPQPQSSAPPTCAKWAHSRSPKSSTPTRKIPRYP